MSGRAINIGDVAADSVGRTGLILAHSWITRDNEERGFVWTGIRIEPHSFGDPWSDPKPKVLGTLAELVDKGFVSDENLTEQAREFNEIAKSNEIRHEEEIETLHGKMDEERRCRDEDECRLLEEIKDLEDDMAITADQYFKDGQEHAIQTLRDMMSQMRYAHIDPKGDPPCTGPGFSHAPHGRCSGYSTDRT